MNGHNSRGLDEAVTSNLESSVERMSISNRQRNADPLFQTGRTRLQKKRATINDKISREILLRNGAENLLQVTRDKRVREQVNLELSYATSHLRLLKQELQDVNNAVEVYQPVTESLLPVIALGLKETKLLSFNKAVGDYIEEHYGESREAYKDSVKRLSELRLQVQTPERSSNGVALLLSYYNHLYFVDRRFFRPARPLGVLFVWFDSFTGVAFTQKSVVFEKACVLYNLAALYSQLAADKDRTHVQGLEESQELFCLASGVLRYLADNFDYAPSMDMKPSLLNMMILLLNAQAQECNFLATLAQQKSGHNINNNNNNNSWEVNLRLAKLAQWVSLSYEKVHLSLAGEVLRYVDYLPDSWLGLVQIKVSYFGALAHHHVCRVLHEWHLDKRATLNDTEVVLVLKQLYKAHFLRRSFESGQIMTLCRAHAREALNHLEEAVRTMSLCKRLSELDDCSALLRKTHNESLAQLSQLGEDEILVTVIPVQTIRAETSWVAAGLPPAFGAHPVEDFFRELGPLSFFEARRAWSHPKEVVISRQDEGGFGFSIKGEFPVTVAAVDADCPAERAGVRVGDVFVRVDGQDVRWCSHERIIQLVRLSGLKLAIWLVSPEPLPEAAGQLQALSMDEREDFRLAARPGNSVPLKQRKSGASKWKKRLSGSWLFRSRSRNASSSTNPPALTHSSAQHEPETVDAQL